MSINLCRTHQQHTAHWICQDCSHPKCDLCNTRSDKPVPFGPQEREAMLKTTKYERRFVCDWCKYPPCCGCGCLRTRKQIKENVQFRLWFCATCQKAKVEKTEQEWPPCSTCGRERPTDQRFRLHDRKSWTCTTCWRAAAT